MGHSKDILIHKFVDNDARGFEHFLKCDAQMQSLHTILRYLCSLLPHQAYS